MAIPEHLADGHKYLEVAVLVVQVRASHSKASEQLRLAELVHRAVPYPVVLIQSLAASNATPPDDRLPPAAAALAISLIHKRAAQNEAGKMVVDGELVRSELVEATGTAAPQAGALLEALALDRLPHQDFMALYQGWIDCLTAAEAARLTGSFRLPNGPTAAAAQREALRTCQRLEQEAARLRSQAAKERQIAKQVDLNLELQGLDARLRAARAQLWTHRDGADSGLNPQCGRGGIHDGSTNIIAAPEHYLQECSSCS